MKRECLECHKEFDPRTTWQTFCGKECQQVFNRRKYRAERVRKELGYPAISEAPMFVDMNDLGELGEL